MKVRYRLLIITAILGLIFLGGFFLMQNRQLEDITLLVKERQSQLNQFFTQILRLEGQSMEVLAFDYTYWDDLVDFVSNGNEVFSKNVLDPSLSSYQVNAIWIFDPDMKKVYFTSDLPGESVQVLPLTSEQMKALFTNSPFAHFNYRTADGQFIEVRAASIHPSTDVAHASLPFGYFFVGKAWGASRLGYLSTLTGGKIALSDQPAPSSTSELTSTNFTVSFPLIGPDNKPIATLQGSFPDPFMLEFVKSQRRDTIVYLVFTPIFLAIIAAALIFWVLRPVQKITQSLSNRNTQPITDLLNEKSEFGRVAVLVKGFLELESQMAATITHHEQTEAALRISEERYRTVSGLISDAAYSLLIHPDGKVEGVWSTEALEKMAGYPIQDAGGELPLFNVIHPEDRHLLENAKKQLLAGQPVVCEYRILNKNGETLWVKDHCNPLPDTQNSSTIQIYGAAQDISKQRLAEETYRLLVDHSIQGLAIIQNGELKFTNQAFTDILGLSPLAISHLQINQLLDSIHPSDLSTLLAQLKNEQGEYRNFERQEIRVSHPDGTWHWLEISGIKIEYNAQPALQLTCLDGTQQKKAQQALIEQQKYSSALLNIMRSLVIVLDITGRVDSCNPAVQRLLQMTNSEITRLHIWEIFDLPELSPLSQYNFPNIIQKQILLNDDDVLFQHEDSRYWFSWSHTFLRDQEGVITYVVGTGTNITERKIRERQQEAITSISTNVRSAQGRYETMVAILDEMIDVFRAEVAAFIVPSHDKGEMIMELVRGKTEVNMNGFRFPMEQGLLSQILQSGKPYLNNNLQDEPHISIPEILSTSHAAAIIPLTVGPKNIGMLVIACKNIIYPDQINLLAPIAEMVTNAIQKATLTDETQQRIQQLTALRTINIAIGASLDLRVTLNVLVNQITSQLGIDAVDVLLLNQHTRTLQFAAGFGFHSKAIQQVRLWLGESQAGRVAQERASHSLYDPSGIENHFSKNNFLDEENFIAYDAVPLVVKGEVKGVLETYHRAPYTPGVEWNHLLESLAIETAIAIDNAELLDKLQRSNMDLAVAYDATIEGWARALEMRDRETEGHTQRVADWSVRMAQGIGITSGQLMHIRRGALLHDIGKMGVPDHILLKNGPLNDQEWAVMREHPRLAYEMLAPIAFLRPALDIPYGHHEHWDGTGYPQGLAGEEIPLAARVFSVIDVWDALSQNRPYRPAWPQAKVLAHLEEQAGKLLDPQMVKAFLEMYPIMSRLR